MQRGLPQKKGIKDVKKIIAVSSAKGGVGKSTIAGTLICIYSQDAC
jgi:ATP-binding protein involved in chromosome partitioning